MNKTYILSLILTLNISAFSFGQDLKKEYQEYIIKFVNYVKTENSDQIANMIIFPFHRESPVTSIKNKQEFISRFNEIFDDSLKGIIIKSNPAKDWAEMGWRGIMLNNGIIWLDFNGRLIAVNHQSAVEKKRAQQIISEEKTNLYPALRQFNKPILVLETERFRIRIDELDSSKFRYASWPSGKGMSEKPDLILNNGLLDFEGSGGNHSYTFKNGDYTYICYIFMIGDDQTPPARLNIYFKDKMILSQNAKLIN